MHSTFPKRDYSESDMSQTLRDLQLAPSATILIIPVSCLTIFIILFFLNIFEILLNR